MPIEPSVNWFSDYDINQPQDGDDLVEGDNHIRNLKKSILAQFPSLGDVAMTLTAATLNLLTGLTATGAQINALQSTYGTRTLASTDDVIDNFPAGTIMSFQQTNAPTGWTKEVTHNNKALRVVTGTAGSGGTNSFTGVLNGSVNVSGTTLSINQIPAHAHGAGSLSAVSNGNHTHTLTSSNGAGGSASTDTVESTGVVNNRTATTSTNGAHTHSITGSTANNSTTGSSHNHNFNLDVQYVDLILAAKD